jgi:hypothetical protein
MTSKPEKLKCCILPDGRMDAKNAADFLGYQPKTLANMRSRGVGPRFLKRGRIFYFEADLIAWLAEQPRARSCAEARLATRGGSPAR